MVGNLRKALPPHRCFAGPSQARGTRVGSRRRSRWSCSAPHGSRLTVNPHCTCKIWSFHIWSRSTRTSPSAPRCRCMRKARLSCLGMIMMITMVTMVEMKMVKMEMSNQLQGVARWRGGSSCSRGRPSPARSRHPRTRRSPV